MKERNIHFEKKYKKTKKLGNFFAYLVSSEAKSNSDLILNQELYALNLKKLNIPSSFKLEKAHDTQGPLVSLIYGTNLTFRKLSYLEKFQVLGIKSNNFFYSHRSLKETVNYQSTENLCFSLSSDMLNKLINLAAVSFLIQENDTNKTNLHC